MSILDHGAYATDRRSGNDRRAERVSPIVPMHEQRAATWQGVVDVLTKMQSEAMPINEAMGDMDARIPAATWREFVDTHASALYALARPSATRTMLHPSEQIRIAANAWAAHGLRPENMSAAWNATLESVSQACARTHIAAPEGVELATYRRALEKIIAGDCDEVQVAHEAITPYTPWVPASPETEARIDVARSDEGTNT